MYVTSPSFHDDPKYALFKAMDTNLVVNTDYTDQIFEGILSQIDANLAVYEKYLRQKALYKKYMRDRDGLKDFRGRELRELEALDHQKPKKPFRNGRPNALLVFDDLTGSSLYRSDSKGPFNSFAIRHRHRSCSIILLSQTYQNSVPRQIRSNLSCVILFSQRNGPLCKEVALEFSSYVSVELFIEMWRIATAEPHSFFMADFEAPAAIRFRKNWDLAFRVGSEKNAPNK
jgi:hypothetical protein